MRSTLRTCRRSPLPPLPAAATPTSASAALAPALSAVPSNQDTWRFVIIAVLLGLTILIVVGATWAVAGMKRGMLATLLTALTWLAVTLLMLGGVGESARTVACASLFGLSLG
jgi:hypothetical protein